MPYYLIGTVSAGHSEHILPNCAAISEVLHHLEYLEDQAGSRRFAEYACSGFNWDSMGQEFRRLQNGVSPTNIDVGQKSAFQGLTLPISTSSSLGI